MVGNSRRPSWLEEKTRESTERMNESDHGSYVLGTHDEELHRLGLQHAVWRPRTLAGWRRAGITQGVRVLDVGAGPGFATADLAEIVGSTGFVMAVEKSARFVQSIEQRLASRKLQNAEAHAVDLMTQPIPGRPYDVAWIRWVASFVSDPSRLVQAIADSLRPGGTAIFHEYVDYATWKLLPANPILDEFVQRVMNSWRRAGGEPDVAKALPTLLTQHGLVVCDTEPVVHCVSPKHEVWQWPASFIDVNLNRLIELNEVTEEWARSVRLALEQAEKHDATRMVTPMVLEIVARKLPA